MITGSTGNLLRRTLMESLIRKIILATDFSEASEDASYHAVLLAQTYNAELKALHVFNPRSIGTMYRSAEKEEKENEDLVKTRERGKRMLNHLADSFHIKADTIVAEGHAGPEIIRIAAEQKADLLVVGTHGYTGWNRLALGSVAEYIVRHSPCAVLTIKPTAREET
jgi:nucleotide-binding universal stress UspA family protein